MLMPSIFGEDLFDGLYGYPFRQLRTQTKKKKIRRVNTFVVNAIQDHLAAASILEKRLQKRTLRQNSKTVHLKCLYLRKNQNTSSRVRNILLLKDKQILIYIQEGSVIYG